MSMFNWHPAPGEAVTSSNIWIYFAIALPLTALVFAIWLTWYFWKVRKGMVSVGKPHRRVVEN